MKSLRHAKTKMTETDQNDMMIHGRGNCHFPLLTSRPAIEEQAAEICQSLRKDNDADDRHDKVKDLQAEMPGEVSDRLEECSREDDIDRFRKTLYRSANEFCDARIGETTANQGHCKDQQWGLELL